MQPDTNATSRSIAMRHVLIAEEIARSLTHADRATLALSFARAALALDDAGARGNEFGAGPFALQRRRGSCEHGGYSGPRQRAVHGGVVSAFFFPP